MIWNDKSKFNIFGSDSCKRDCKEKKEPLCDAHIQPKVKHSRGSNVVWRCMSWEKVGNFRLIENIMDNFVYLEILQKELLVTIEIQEFDVSIVVFQ